MRKTLAVAAVALMAGPLLAQFGGFGAMDGKALLVMPTVQDELKLSEAQKKELAEATEALSKGIRAAFADQDFGAITKLRDDHGKVVAKVMDKLDDKQKQRLAELEFQAGTKGQFKNPRVFGYAGIQKALELKDKQKETIKAQLGELEKDFKEIDDESKGDPLKQFQSMRKKNEMNAQTYEKILEALDEAQKKSFDKVGGKSFDLPTFKFGKDKGKKEEKKKEDF